MRAGRRAVAYYVYILAREKRGTLYIGVTNDVVRRVYEHREGLADGFTKQHDVNRRVYVEAHDRADQAIQREKSLKRWLRAWKVALIERDNPDWNDLYGTLQR